MAMSKTKTNGIGSDNGGLAFDADPDVQAVTFNLTPNGTAERWHDGSGQITYSFLSKIPGYYKQVDLSVPLDNKPDAYESTELTPSTTQQLFFRFEQSLASVNVSLANEAIKAWNEVANTKIVPFTGGGGLGAGLGAIDTPILGDGTLMSGLGGTLGFGEFLVPRESGGSGGEMAFAVDISSVFENGLQLPGMSGPLTTIYIDANGGGVTFNSAAVLSIAATFLSHGSLFNPEIVVPFIAPFIAPVQTMLIPDQPGYAPPQVIYDLDPVKGIFTVTWAAVDYVDSDFGIIFPGDVPHVQKANYFQLQLYDRGGGGGGVGNDFDIVFRYDHIEWTTGDGLFSGGGTDGLNANGNGSAWGGWYGGGDNKDVLFGPESDATLLALPNTTGNTGQQGLYVYEIRNGPTQVGDITFGAFELKDKAGNPIAGSAATSGRTATDELVHRGGGSSRRRRRCLAQHQAGSQ